MATSILLALHDRATGERLGELNEANDISYDAQRTLSFTLDESSAWPLRLISDEYEHYVAIYLDGILSDNFPIIDLEVVGSRTDSIRVVCGNPIWALTARPIGKASPPVPVKYSGQRGMLIKQIVDELNAEPYGETGIRTNAAWVEASSVVEIECSYRPASDVIEDLTLGSTGALVDGIEYWCKPIEYDGGKICELYIGSVNTGEPNEIDPKLIGVYRPNAIFERGRGTREGVEDFNMNISRQALANVVNHIADESTAVMTIDNEPSMILRGRREAVITSMIYDPTLRTSLIEAHLNARKVPRKAISFTPSAEGTDGSVPRYLVDYNRGDIVTLRVVAFGQEILNVQLRVWGVQVVQSYEGHLTHTLKLLPE